MKGTHTQALEMGIHAVKYNSPIPLLLSVDDVPVAALQAGNGKFTIRYLKGKLSVDPSDAKTKYMFEVTTRITQPTETVDNEPPPQPAPPANWLQAIKQRVQQSMAVQREGFAEHQTIYEVVDDLDTFEEERAQARQDAASADEPSEGTTDEPVDGDQPPTTHEPAEPASDPKT